MTISPKRHHSISATAVTLLLLVISLPPSRLAKKHTVRIVQLLKPVQRRPG